MDKAIDDLSYIVNAFTAYNGFVTDRPTATNHGDTISIGLGNVGCLISHNLSDCLIALNETIAGDWRFKISPVSRCAYYELNSSEGVSPLQHVPDVIPWTKEISINIGTILNSKYTRVSLKCLNKTDLTVIGYESFLEEQPLVKSSSYLVHFLLAVLILYTLLWIGFEKWILKKL